jgi:hypothetical protein
MLTEWMQYNNVIVQMYVFTSWQNKTNKYLCSTEHFPIDVVNDFRLKSVNFCGL